nr:hypothetical protein KPHV_87800 [Kitasatospora purpeofusca]
MGHPGSVQREHALQAAAGYLERAERILPGIWGFFLAPGGEVGCLLCGGSDRTGEDGYRPRSEAHAWYEEHARTCTPAPVIECGECALCGYCRSPRTPIHHCDRCDCDRDDHD